MGVIGYGHPSHNGSPYSETVRYDGYILDIYGGINMCFFYGSYSYSQRSEYPLVN